MILLDGHSLKQKRKVPVISMQLTLQERDGSATIVPADMTGITIGAWLQDDTNPGKGIVWRVKSIRQNYNTDTCTVQLEHIINSLRDTILFGEVTPTTITGKKATKCTAKQALTYILGKSGDWTLGGFTHSASNPYKFDGDTLYDALETVTDSLEDAEWTANTSVYPFVLHIMPYETGTGSVLRPGRNLKTITKTIDRSGMYTRFYPIGANDLHLSGNGYVQRNTGTYGVVSKVETDQSITTEAELQRWAEERLKKWAEPTVSIDIDGLELADATGQTLDRLKLGMICWVPLREFGTEIRERIVTLNYPNKIRNPEEVRITLANNRRDVTKIIGEAIRKSGKSGRTSSKKAKQDNAWFEDTNDHVAMCAKGIIGTDAKGNPNWTRLSEIIVDGTGIHQTVETMNSEMEGYASRIDQNEKSVSLVVGKNKKGRFIRAGQICLAINDDGDAEATIEAKKIHLLGETIANKITASYIKTKIASMSSVNVKTLNATNYIYASDFVIGSSSGGQGSNQYVHNAVQDLQITKSGTTVKLQKKDFKDSDWVDVGSFSRATALSGMWSGGKITMSANADNVPDLIQEIRAGDPSWSSRTVTIKIYAYTNSGQLIGETGREVSATYTLPKTAITLTRQKQSSEPSTDGTLSQITSNGWYQLDVTAAGVTKTWKVRVNVT